MYIYCKLYNYNICLGFPDQFRRHKWKPNWLQEVKAKLTSQHDFHHKFIYIFSLFSLLFFIHNFKFYFIFKYIYKLFVTCDLKWSKVTKDFNAWRI